MHLRSFFCSRHIQDRPGAENLSSIEGEVHSRVPGAKERESACPVVPHREDSEAVRDQVMAVVRSAFRPEFLNRLDETLLFHRLTRSQMGGIVDIQLARLCELLAERKVMLELDVAARAWLADAGYDSVYGARPLKRVIQRGLQNQLASLLLEGRINEGDTVNVSAGADGLVINGETFRAEAAE